MEIRVKIDEMTPEATLRSSDYDGVPARTVAEILARRGENVITQFSESLRPDNAEGIHDLRVAIRRFRTAMRDLTPLVDKKAARTINEELKTIAAVAGEVRDNDVAKEVLQKLSAESSDPEIAAAINDMATRRDEMRDAGLVSLAALLTPENSERLASQIRSYTAAAGEADIAADAANSAMEERRGEFLELVPTLYDPLDVEGHHRLRIAAKRLRYSTELFDRTPRGSDPSPPERIAEMQDHLGDMHDCDVWIGTLRKNLKKYLKNDRDQTPEFRAAEWLLGEFVRRRAKNYREALELWAEWRRSGFVKTLRYA